MAVVRFLLVGALSTNNGGGLSSSSGPRSKLSSATGSAISTSASTCSSSTRPSSKILPLLRRAFPCVGGVNGTGLFTGRPYRLWGAPLLEQTEQAIASTRKRVEQTAAGVALLARTHPAQALQLLRATLGASRVEYLLQAMTPSSITKILSIIL